MSPKLKPLVFLAGALAIFAAGYLSARPEGPPAAEASREQGVPSSNPLGWPAVCGKAFAQPTEADQKECAQAGGRILQLVSSEGTGFECGCCKESPAGATLKRFGQGGAYHNHCVNADLVEVWRCAESGDIVSEKRQCSCKGGQCVQ